MKKYSIIIIMAALTLFSISANAQLSVGAGYLNTSLMDKQGSVSTSENFNGFYIEADYKFDLYNNFIGIAPGLRYNFGTTEMDGANWSEQYLDIPVMVDLGYDFSDNLRLFAFTGPTVSVGLSSKMKASGVEVNMYKFTEDFLGDAGTYGRFDIMFGYGFGVDLMGCLRIKASLDHGLLNRMKNESGVVTRRNLIKLGVAYVF